LCICFCDTRATPTSFPTPPVPGHLGVLTFSPVFCVVLEFLAKAGGPPSLFSPFLLAVREDPWGRDVHFGLLLRSSVLPQLVFFNLSQLAFPPSQELFRNGPFPPRDPGMGFVYSHDGPFSPSPILEGGPSGVFTIQVCEPFPFSCLEAHRIFFFSPLRRDIILSGVLRHAKGFFPFSFLSLSFGSPYYSPASCLPSNFSPPSSFPPYKGSSAFSTYRATTPLISLFGLRRWFCSLSPQGAMAGRSIVLFLPSGRSIFRSNK